MDKLVVIPLNYNEKHIQDTVSLCIRKVLALHAYACIHVTNR